MSNMSNNSGGEEITRKRSLLFSQLKLGSDDQNGVNEFSIFHSEELDEENKLLDLDDDKLYGILVKKYKTKKDKANFESKFYHNDYINTPPFTAKEFSSIGVFEDLSFYPVWMNDKTLEPIVKEFKEKYDIYYWRRIRGDGNCFYKSIIITYFEKIISMCFEEKKPSYFFLLIKDFLYIKGKVKANAKNLEPQTFTFLLYIYDEIKNYSQKAFDILYRVINTSNMIEKDLILWFKIKMVDFLYLNWHLELSGIKIAECIPGLNSDVYYEMDEAISYINDKLLKMGEYVEGYPLYITPFILQCDIEIYFINSLNGLIQKEQIAYQKEVLFSPVGDLPYIGGRPDGKISILFQKPHYNSLSTRAHVNSIVSVYTNPDIILIEGIITPKAYEKYKTEVLENIERKPK